MMFKAYRFRTYSDSLMKDSDGLSTDELTRLPEHCHLQPEQKVKIRCVGLTMGRRYFLIMSDGTRIENPRYFDEDIKHIQLLQNKFDLQFRSNSDSHKLRRKIVRRNAFLQQLTAQIVRQYDIITVKKSASRDPLAGKQVSSKISAVTWRTFITMLARKADQYGKQLIQIESCNDSSMSYCKCHYKIGKLPLYIRDGKCLSSDTSPDRDINAAISIMTQGVKIYLNNNPDVRKKQQLIPALSNRR